LKDEDFLFLGFKQITESEETCNREKKYKANKQQKQEIEQDIEENRWAMI
jgi:hypothetical protein